MSSILDRWAVSDRTIIPSQRKRLSYLVSMLTVACAVLTCWNACVSAETPAEKGALVEAGEVKSSDAERPESLREFTRSIYPLLTRDGSSCVDCHSSEETSNLVLIGDPADDFQVLLQNRYFDPDRPDGLLARVTSDDDDLRMPQGDHPWSDRDVQLLRSFLRRLDVPLDPHADERFPAALTTPYTGKGQGDVENPFITATQLRGKVITIFEDDWVRDGRDLFAENVAVFGGADFKTRYTETRDPSTSFLSGLTMLASDVSHRALVRRKGPFAEHRALDPPGDRTEPDGDYRDQIDRLFQAILFRSPSEAETRQAYALIRDVYAAEPSLRTTDYELAFRVTVVDPETGLEATRTVRVPVSAESTPLYQEWVDQSAGQETEQEGLVRQTLAPRFRFAGGEAARVVIRNDGSTGNVSFAGLQWKRAGEDDVHAIDADDPRVRVEGAWTASRRRDVTSFEDGDVEKGNSHITVAWEPPDEGKYELSILWRQDAANAEQVLVEVGGDRVPDQLALPAPASVPGRGEAKFFYDGSDDTLPYAELDAWFRFGPEDAIEINNTGTRGRVTAAAVDFEPIDGEGESFRIDSVEAEGSDAWEKYDTGRFRAYNVEGTQLHDNDRDKGERYLRYRPGKGEAAERWRDELFYRPKVHYPGKRENATRVPVIVHARQSSPIVQVRHPARARADATVELDASASYTVQHSELEYKWEQLGGPPVKIDPSSADGRLTFTAPRRSPKQAAWEALARGLMRHPDFLFTRPPSLRHAKDPAERKRLQLVKIALDLVGRAPNRDELQRLAEGGTLGELVDGYLDSQEFRDFYFHRIRLYLESQGTETQDEPVRLWCYVAFHDHPFQEILTADYTVDKEFNKRARPEHHGKTGLLTTKGFIEGKPGLPHYNYAAQVSMMFLGYVFEVPSDIIDQRDGITPAGTTDRTSACYSCHKTLTPLAMQRQLWTDDGKFRTKDKDGLKIDASDQGLVDEYPFPGVGMEAFATQAVRKERFIRTMINTHFHFYMGRNLRFRTDERELYKTLWDHVHEDGFTIRGMIRKLMSRPEYLADS